MSLVTKRPPSAAVAHGAPHAAKVDLSSLGDALGIKPKKACKVLDCGTTHVYDLMKKKSLSLIWTDDRGKLRPHQSESMSPDGWQHRTPNRVRSVVAP
jgi:hypothetical protein